MLVFHEIHTTRNYEKESCFIFIQRLAIKLEIKKMLLSQEFRRITNGNIHTRRFIKFV